MGDPPDPGVTKDIRFPDVDLEKSPSLSTLSSYASSNELSDEEEDSEKSVSSEDKMVLRVGFFREMKEIRRPNRMTVLRTK